MGAIQQFIMDEGELLTVGTDGFIRVWDFETIDQVLHFITTTSLLKFCLPLEYFRDLILL